MKKMFLAVAARNDSVNSTSLQSNKSNTSTLYSERYAQVLIYKQVVLVNQQDLLGLYMFARHDIDQCRLYAFCNVTKKVLVQESISHRHPKYLQNHKDEKARLPNHWLIIIINFMSQDSILYV